MSAAKPLPEPLQMLLQECQSLAQHLSGLQLAPPPDSDFPLQANDQAAIKKLLLKNMSRLQTRIERLEAWCNGPLNKIIAAPHINRTHIRRTVAKLSGHVADLQALRPVIRPQQQTPAMQFAAAMLDRVLIHLLLQIRDFAENTLTTLTALTPPENGDSLQLELRLALKLGSPGEDLIAWLAWLSAQSPAPTTRQPLAQHRGNLRHTFSSAPDAFDHTPNTPNTPGQPDNKTRNFIELIISLIMLALIGLMLWCFGLTTTLATLAVLCTIALIIRHPIIAALVLLLTGLGS